MSFIFTDASIHRLDQPRVVCASGARVGNLTIANGSGSAVTVSGIPLSPSDDQDAGFFVAVPTGTTVTVTSTAVQYRHGLKVAASTPANTIVVSVNQMLGRK